MLATRWQPFADTWSELGRLQSDMNRVFERFGRSGRWSASYPALDLWQDEDSFYVEAELPGMAIEDLEIYVSGENQLSIKGTSKPPEIEKAAWHRRERSFGNFARVLNLPGTVDAESVEASMANGVLSIRLPKARAAQPRRIEVKTG